MDNGCAVEVATSIRYAEGRFVDIHSALPPRSGHLPSAGAIELTFGETPVLTRDMWDDITLLWINLVGALTDLVHHGRGAARFPDQPMVCVLRRRGNGWVRVSVEDGGPEPLTASSALESDLLACLRREGPAILRRLGALDPDGEGWADEAIAELESLPPTGRC
ncbi:hypothetical protein [Salinactinospora qingdaonensis]|uniref:MDMPI C-terminal domain-containing protein n=1 Tax=Salinactinospora qingdaonensis TaxID=702744 RepID=A0ABP7F5A6_9ACTN